MKFYLTIVGIFCALVLVQCQSLEELKKTFEECAKEVGLPTSEDILKATPNFDDPKEKCLSACIMKKDKTLIDGKVVIEKVIERAAKVFIGGATDTIKADIKECANKANEGKDECDVAGTFDKCFIEKHPPPKE